MTAWRPWLILLTVCTLGVFLRFQQISIQWLIDDEWHAVHKVIASDGYLSILTSFGHTDYSIPLTLYDRLLADTIGLSELRMRMPMLLAGSLFLVLSILWVKARFGHSIAICFGFLVATSPMLVNFSRNARPYMITLLLGAIAIWALARWTRDSRRWPCALIYLLCAWMASYLHLIMAPFVLTPLLLSALTSSTKGAGPSIGRVAAVCGVIGVCMALTILPPLLFDWSSMADKTGADLPNMATLIGVWYGWLGSGSSITVGICIVLAAIGYQPLKSNAALEFAMWLSGLAGIVLVVLVMRPAWVQTPLTFGRYLLPVLPLLLLLVAAGASRIGERLPPLGKTAFLAALAVSIFPGTLYRGLLDRPNNFTLHSYYQFDYREHLNPVRGMFAPFATPSAFWSRFRDADAEKYIIAIGGIAGFESFYNLQLLYQPVHKQRLLNLQTSGACGEQRLGEAFPSQGVYLRNAVSLAVDGDLDAKNVDWVVIDVRQGSAAHLVGLQQSSWREPQCVSYLRKRFGAPEYADDELIAFRISDR
ncbi:glycosyltransferase family 39 protein [Azoarcus sp. L1K30]|uniref:glycosyltransferase family 39 protein n=1 Tax=Azoarcus sp. L1K30 TaxID=2820277 RepID=UPI001B833616|nr:glycosyltransferase family 39 protein [Azoarcus sp. L1K30]MBR0568238.1 glycosyltransferase family 39 protein [Azoarcus sp. L1K30]